MWGKGNGDMGEVPICYRSAWPLSRSLKMFPSGNESCGLLFFFFLSSQSSLQFCAGNFTPSIVVLKLEGASEAPGGPHHQSFWSSRSGVGPENLHISNKFPDADTDAASLRPHFEDHWPNQSQSTIKALTSRAITWFADSPGFPWPLWAAPSVSSVLYLTGPKMNTSFSFSNLPVFYIFLFSVQRTFLLQLFRTKNLELSLTFPFLSRRPNSVSSGFRI